MELLRRDSDYALRAVTALARQRAGTLASAATIARTERLTEPLLRKLLQRLNRAGVVESVRGKTGGFRLAQDPGRITSLDVVEAIQGKLAIQLCFLGTAMCPSQKNCTIRNKLGPVQAALRMSLKNITIADLINDDGNRQKTDGPRTRRQEV